MTLIADAPLDVLPVGALASGGTETTRADPRAWIDALFDEGTFVEIRSRVRHRTSDFGLAERRPAGDDVITGWGEVDGRRVFVAVQDRRVLGGSLGEMGAAKIHDAMDRALTVGCPFVTLNDGGGARIQEGIRALAGYGGIFARSNRASGVIPQISLILGACAGGAAYAPALGDFTIMSLPRGRMFVTGPDVVANVTGESTTMEALGGASMHATTAGSASFVATDDEDAIDILRSLLSYLPSNNLEPVPHQVVHVRGPRHADSVGDLVPDDPARAYDIRSVIAALVDEGDFLEVQESYARNIVCGFGRFQGEAVGIVGNQASVLAGALDAQASEKAARFVRTCDAFNVPLLTLVDVPGFLPGSDQEHSGLVRRGAKLLYAYCEATVPRIQVILRKAYGGAYIVMDSKSIGCDVSLAWPRNEIAVMGADGACSIIHRRQLSRAGDNPLLRAGLARQYADAVLSPETAAEQGLVDEIIEPWSTRERVIDALHMLGTKHVNVPQRKHGNVPL